MRTEQQKQHSREYMREYRRKNPQYLRRCLDRNAEIRLSVMDILGGRVCSSCGFDDVRVLHLDHKNSGGTKERESFGSTTNMWYFYKRNPEIAKQKLQVLCANCNQIKQREKEEFSWKTRLREKCN